MSETAPVKLLQVDQAEAAWLANAGHQPTEGRITVMPTPGCDAMRINVDLLRAIGKRRDIDAWPRDMVQARALVTSWYASERIDDVFVWQAQNLDREVHDELAHLAKGVQLWLIATHRIRPQALAAYDEVVGGSSDDLRVARADHTVGAVAEEWNQIPALPLADFVLFRHACATQLGADDNRRIAEAMRVGVEHARGTLHNAIGWTGQRPVEPAVLAAQLVEVGVDPTIPPPASLAMLRGAQLECFAQGWLLRFHAEALMRIREALPPLDSHTIDVLRRVIWPRRAALVTIYATTGASSAALAAMDHRDVLDDGRTVHVGAHRYRIPTALTSVLEVYLQAEPATPRTPLFHTKSGNRYSPHGLRTILRRSLETYAMHAGIDRVLAPDPRGGPTDVLDEAAVSAKRLEEVAA